MLDVGCGDGLNGFGALGQVGPDGRVIFSDVRRNCSTAVSRFGEIADGSVGALTVRSVLIYLEDRDAAFAEFFRVLRLGGRLSVFEPLNSYPAPAERWGPWDVTPVHDLTDRVKDVFRAIYDEAGNSMHDFGVEDIVAGPSGAGFGEVTLNAMYALTPAQPRASWDVDERRAANLSAGRPRRATGSNGSAHVHLRAVR